VATACASEAGASPGLPVPRQEAPGITRGGEGDRPPPAQPLPQVPRGLLERGAVVGVSHAGPLVTSAESTSDTSSFDVPHCPDAGSWQEIDVDASLPASDRRRQSADDATASLQPGTRP